MTEFVQVTVPAMGRNHRIVYFDRPAGVDSKPIVYVHGLGCSANDFLGMCEETALDGFRLISADHPGCGQSEYSDAETINIEGLVELFEGFTNTLGLSRFMLVGGSLGGLVALLYAERQPERLSGFVNVEGNLAPEDCLYSQRVVECDYAQFCDVVFPKIKQELSESNGEGFQKHLSVLSVANPKAYYDYSFQTVDYSHNGKLLDRFMRLKIPTRFIYGSENSGLSYLPRLRDNGCDVVEIPNANHFLFYDNPRAFATACATFAQERADWQ
jgi:pimeloyl-ACP methyl ester carboxylesterase